jgi:hypothetical protein
LATAVSNTTAITSTTSTNTATSITAITSTTITAPLFSGTGTNSGVDEDAERDWHAIVGSAVGGVAFLAFIGRLWYKAGADCARLPAALKEVLGCDSAQPVHPAPPTTHTLPNTTSHTQPPIPPATPSVGITWECEVDGSWKEYAPNASAQLEAAYNAKDDEVSFSYTIPGQTQVYPYIFKHLQTANTAAVATTQTNQNTDVTRRVRRRELRLLPIAPRQSSGAVWCTPKTDLEGGASLRRLIYPDDPNDLAAYTQDNDEIKKCLGTAMAMSDNFRTSGPNATQVKAVDYINNPNVYARYKDCQARFRVAGKPTNEVWVFHGTKELRHAEAIAKDKFLIGGVDGHPVKNAAVWGNAVYTDVKPDTPKAYGEFVLLCKALLGAHQMIRDNKGSVADPCPGFDSWNPPSRASWRMFRKNEQLLPVYIIHLK